MSGEKPNATPARPGPPWLQRSVPPRHETAWIRIRGRWRRAVVRAWVLQDQTRWEVLIEAEAWDGSPWNGLYVYDPETIRPRHSDEPPGD
jgi:hypothetical protein